MNFSVFKKCKSINKSDTYSKKSKTYKYYFLKIYLMN